MKKIEAIIRQTRFDYVREALEETGVEWFSYNEVRGVGQANQKRIYRGVIYDTSSIERILISCVVRAANVESTIEAIMKAAKTGEIGDGRIFVIPVDTAIRIRTGERGDRAVYNSQNSQDDSQTIFQEDLDIDSQEDSQQISQSTSQRNSQRSSQQDFQQDSKNKFQPLFQ